MPEVLTALITTIGTGVGGVVGAGLIMYAGSIAAGAPIIGSAFVSKPPAADAQPDAASTL